MRDIKKLNLDEYIALKKTGMLWEIYPHATGIYVVDVLGREDG